MKIIVFVLAVSALAQEMQMQFGPNTAVVPQTPTGDGVIEVVVTNSASREPVRKANVTLFGPGPAISLQTDASGKAVFERLPDGEFKVHADHQSFPPPRRIGAWQQQAELKPGERKRQVAISMTPSASLTGRITDEDGDPLSNCNVQVMRRDPMHRGGIGGFGGAQAKPNGEYRIFNVPGGRYYVTAHCQGPMFVPHPLSDQPPRATVMYLPQVYPGVSDFASATMLDLAPGAERSGVDFRMAKGPVSNALVKLFPPEPPPGAQLQVMLVPRDPFFQALQGMHGSAFNPNLGGYLFDHLLPGRYEVSAFTVGPGKKYGGRTTVEVEGGKTSEVGLPVGYAADLTGKLEMEDSGSGAFAGAQLFLMAVDGPQGPGSQESAKVDENGAFTLSGVFPGLWSVRVYGLPNNGFIKSVSLAGREVPNRILDLTAGVAGPLHIVVGTKGGTVEGTLRSEGGTPPPNPQVILYPESGDFFQMRATNAEGSRYRLADVPPGKYHLIAVASLSHGISPDMAGSLAALSKTVEVEEGGSVIADIKVLSSEEVQKALSAEPE